MWQEESHGEGAAEQQDGDDEHEQPAAGGGAAPAGALSGARGLEGALRH